MNTRPLLESSSNPTALSASFNQDSTCFAVGLDTGFCSTSTLFCEEEANVCFQYLILNHASFECLEVRCPKPYTSLRILSYTRLQRRHRCGRDAREGKLCCAYWRRKATQVPSKQSRWSPAVLPNNADKVQVIIWNDAKQNVAMQLPVLTTVRGVRLSRTHVVVALQNSIRVYNFKSTPDIWGVFETADNPLGLCCLTAKHLAFPGRTPGQVQLVELGTSNISIIPAHSSSLRALDISQDGEILATASETVNIPN